MHRASVRSTGWAPDCDDGSALGLSGGRPYDGAPTAVDWKRGRDVKSDQKLKLLATVPLFARLRGRALERVGQLADEVDVPAGRVLIRQGTTGHEFFIVIEGRVRVERDGRPVSVRGAGDFVGEIALIDEGPRSATVTTETPCRLLVLNHREFHTLLSEQPEIQLVVLRTLAERVRQLDPDRHD